MELIDIITDYYDKRQLAYPDVWEALAWANTELGETYELLLSRNKRWVRNNPQNKEEFSKERFAEELSDIIMMIMVAGYVEGVNPIQALKDKIKRKLEKLNEETNTTVDSNEIKE